jgi:hypothetical protein
VPASQTSPIAETVATPDSTIAASVMPAAVAPGVSVSTAETSTNQVTLESPTQSSSANPSLDTSNAEKNSEAQGISKIANAAPVLEPASKISAPFNRPMDKYTYPEGRFKVMLPGSPQVKYSDQSGMRMVDYVYVVPEGSFNISYVILPETPPNLKTSQLLDNMSQSVVNSLKGLHTKQYPSSLQGFSGCQLEIPELANKAGQSARFRIYIVQNYIYIVGLTGKKDWLSASNAKEFLDSFQIISQRAQAPSYSGPTPTTSKSPQSQAEMDAERARMMQYQKDREQRAADLKYHRTRQ